MKTSKIFLTFFFYIAFSNFSFAQSFNQLNEQEKDDLINQIINSEGGDNSDIDKSHRGGNSLLIAEHRGGNSDLDFNLSKTIHGFQQYLNAQGIKVDKKTRLELQLKRNINLQLEFMKYIKTSPLEKNIRQYDV